MKQASTIPSVSAQTKERQTAEALVEKLISEFKDKILAVVLFGSRARGDATEESDMDFLIIMPEVDMVIRRQIRFLATEIWLEYGIFLSTSILSLMHWHQLQKLETALYRNIRSDGIILFQQSNLDELNVVE